MPLSEHEQRLLEQIERSLIDEDPKFASTVRANDPHHHAIRRVVWAIILFVIGLGLLVFGLISGFAPGGVPVLSIAGFLLMVGGAVMTVQSYRKTGRGGELHIVGGKEPPSKRARGHKNGGSWVDRLEQRWHRRRDGY